MPYDKKTPVSVKKWYAGCAFPVNLHEPFGPYMDFSKYGATKAYPVFKTNTTQKLRLHQSPLQDVHLEDGNHNKHDNGNDGKHNELVIEVHYA